MKTPKTLSSSEIQYLLKYLLKNATTPAKKRQQLRNYLIVLLMLDAGLRVGEVIQLRVCELIFNDMPVKAIRIQAEIAKNHKERVIPASNKIQDGITMAKRMLWRFKPEYTINWAFTTRNRGTHVTARTVQVFLAGASKMALGYEIHPHMLRHTFATRLMRVTSVAVVQQLLGHVNLQTTQIYTHPDADDRQKAINAL